MWRLPITGNRGGPGGRFGRIKAAPRMYVNGSTRRTIEMASVVAGHIFPYVVLESER